MLFDQRHFGTETGSDHGCNQPGRSCSNHHHVVPTCRFRIDPIGGMHIADKLLIRLVARKNQWLMVFTHIDDS
jgi:hypothetical protein